jgi:hypothetical protein
MFLSRRGVTFLVAAGLLAASLGATGIEAVEPPAETGVLRDGFETGRVTWQREYTDATVRLLTHERSDRAAHGGRSSERFLFEAGPGSRFYVSEALPNVPVTEDLTLSVYVRSNQSGAQLFGWACRPTSTRTRRPLPTCWSPVRSSAGPTGGKSWNWSTSGRRSRSRPGSSGRRRGGRCRLRERIWRGSC